ncbi:MAG: hypothetical protein J6X65_03345 [Bacteroidales bacterium]|nr:hypothetical protein [Bacteroidales bacterium]
MHPNTTVRMLYILIAIFIVAIFMSTRRKPKKSPVASSAEIPDGDKPNPGRSPKFKQPKMRKSEQNSPKNESYFTYETLEPENLTDPVSPSTYPNSSIENEQQIIENEQQNTIDLKFDEEEIKKGLIYSIILEKPDF